MCLSVAYRNEMLPEKIIMKNVVFIECRDGKVILTDLMDRTCEIEGSLEKADLTEGYVIIRTQV
ncbi:MAG TPA: CooT family nickel-binding protein [Clostridia bacterium]